MQKITLKLLAIAALLAYVTIVLGAATRVYDAGVSCPDWPLCYGQLFPFPTPHGGFWAEGVHYELHQVLLEWTHRLVAMFTGWATLAAAIMIATKKLLKPRWLGFVPLLLIAVQIKLGGLTVVHDNIHWSVAVHLGMAMLFFGSLIWLRRLVARETIEVIEIPTSTKLIKSWAWLTAALVWVTMLIGAMVSTSYSGGSCGGLFDCHGSWLGENFHEVWHMKHRYFALITALTIVSFFMLVRKIPALKKSAIGLKILLLGQIGLGIATLYSFSYYAEFYKLLSTLHLAWGTLLFMASVGTILKIYYGSAGSFHDRKK